MTERYPEIEYVVVEKKRRPLYQRIGCLLMIPIWLLFAITPLVMIILAVEGDITIEHGGDVPNKFQHPLFQLKLVMEEDFRGLNITNSSLYREGENDFCIQNNVRFILWEGEGDPASYCQCYERDDPDADWLSISSEEGSCDAG
jgi:hypothetical protein